MPVADAKTKVLALLEKLSDNEDLARLAEIFRSPFMDSVVTVQDGLVKSLGDDVPAMRPAAVTRASVAAFGELAAQAAQEKVSLTANDQGFGLLLMGGADMGFEPFISGLAAGGAADQTGQLRRGDRVVEVSGVNVTKKTHQEVIELLKKGKPTVELVVSHDVGRLKEVELNRGESGLGINISGGSESQWPVFISRVIPGGIAAEEGTLRRGDMLLEVNGESVGAASHDQVVSLIGRESSVKLVAWRNPIGLHRLEQMMSERHMAEQEKVVSQHVIEFKKGPQGLGLEIQGGAESKTQVSVSKVVPDSPAAATDLRPGDVITEIDGHNLEKATHKEAVEVMKGCSGVVRLVVSRSEDHIKTVIIHRDEKGFGFNILGGADQNSSIFVSRVVPKGAAAADGLLKRGDELVEINDVNVENATHKEAVGLLKSAKGSVRMVVKHNLSALKAIEARMEKKKDATSTPKGTPKEQRKSSTPAKK